MEAINLVDEFNVESVLAALPPEVLELIHEFAANYRPGPMIAIGGTTNPAPEKIAQINRCFDRCATWKR